MKGSRDGIELGRGAEEYFETDSQERWYEREYLKEVKSKTQGSCSPGGGLKDLTFRRTPLFSLSAINDPCSAIATLHRDSGYSNRPGERSKSPLESMVSDRDWEKLIICTRFGTHLPFPLKGEYDARQIQSKDEPYGKVFVRGQKSRSKSPESQTPGRKSGKSESQASGKSKKGKRRSQSKSEEQGASHGATTTSDPGPSLQPTCILTRDWKVFPYSYSWASSVSPYNADNNSCRPVFRRIRKLNRKAKPNSTGADSNANTREHQSLQESTECQPPLKFSYRGFTQRVIGSILGFLMGSWGEWIDGIPVPRNWGERVMVEYLVAIRERGY